MDIDDNTDDSLSMMSMESTMSVYIDSEDDNQEESYVDNGDEFDSNNEVADDSSIWMEISAVIMGYLGYNVGHHHQQMQDLHDIFDNLNV